MEHRSDDERDVTDSEIEQRTKKPRSNEIDAMVQNQGENHFEEVSDETIPEEEEKNKREQAFYDAETLKMDCIAQDYVARIVEEQGKINRELVSEKLKRDWVTWALDKPRVCSDTEVQKLEEKKQQHVRRIDSLSKASMELWKAHESVLRLTEEQKKEKVEAMKKIFQLESKHKLQLRIEEVKGKIEAVKKLGDDEPAIIQGNMNEMTEQLKQEIENLNHLEILIGPSFQPDAGQKWQDNQKKIQELSKNLEKMTQSRDNEINAFMISRERVGALERKLEQVDDELWEARRVTAEVLMTLPARARTVIGIKRVGKIDRSAFVSDFMEKRLPKRIAELAAERKCALWEIMFSDPDWCPFKTIDLHEGFGMEKEVVDELDERLIKLKEESTQAVYGAVITALEEIIEYNPIEKTVLDELWNFEEGRKAELAEAIDLIVRCINRRRVRDMHLERLGHGPRVT